MKINFTSTGALAMERDRHLKVAWRAAAEALLQRHGWHAVDHAEGVLRADVTDPVYVWWKPPGDGFRYSVRLIISPKDHERPDALTFKPMQVLVLS